MTLRGHGKGAYQIRDCLHIMGYMTTALQFADYFNDY